LVKKPAYNFVILILILSFFLFISACAKKVIEGGKFTEEKNKEISGTEDKSVPSGGAELRLKAEREKAEREALLKEEALRNENARKEADKRAAADRKKAKLREEIENEDIRFNYDTFSLSNEAMMILARKSSWLLEHPNVRVAIEGHCDERGTNEYNMALGDRRSVSAMNYLINTGVRTGIFSVISFGEEKPVDPGHDEKAWAMNRRVHFRVLSD
jgi:peptidoglycan-associated lipoprotein